MKKFKKFTFTVVGTIVVYETLRKTGALDQIKGRVKHEIGKLLVDPKLMSEGTMDTTKGKVKEVSHKVKEEIEDNLEA